jgi:hypothetical protein
LQKILWSLGCRSCERLKAFRNRTPVVEELFQKQSFVFLDFLLELGLLQNEGPKRPDINLASCVLAESLSILLGQLLELIDTLLSRKDLWSSEVVV